MLFFYKMPKRTNPKPKKKTKGTKKMGGKKSGGKKKGRCWSGYKPTPGKKAFSKGSCQKS
tara:strand:+ start:244 stop:423 length:180 start_codon:yes stop_codon:yes gene_type:complete